MDNKRERKRNTNKRDCRDRRNNTRRVNQIYKQYKDTGEIPKPKKSGRPKKELSEEEIEAIKKAYEEYRCAIVLQKILKKRGYNISKNKIHKVLKMNGYAREEKNKQRKKK